MWKIIDKYRRPITFALFVAGCSLVSLSLLNNYYGEISLPNRFKLKSAMLDKMQLYDAYPRRYALYDGGKKVIAPHILLLAWSGEAVYGMRQDIQHYGRSYFFYSRQDKNPQFFVSVDALDTYLLSRNFAKFSTGDKFSPLKLGTNDMASFLFNESQKYNQTKSAE